MTGKNPKRGPKPNGPNPDRLVLNGPWREAVRAALARGRLGPTKRRKKRAV